MCKFEKYNLLTPATYLRMLSESNLLNLQPFLFIFSNKNNITILQIFFTEAKE